MIINYLFLKFVTIVKFVYFFGSRKQLFDYICHVTISIFILSTFSKAVTGDIPYGYGNVM